MVAMTEVPLLGCCAFASLGAAGTWTPPGVGAGGTAKGRVWGAVGALAALEPPCAMFCALPRRGLLRAARGGRGCVAAPSHLLLWVQEGPPRGRIWRAAGARKQLPTLRKERGSFSWRLVPYRQKYPNKKCESSVITRNSTSTDDLGHNKQPTNKEQNT